MARIRLEVLAGLSGAFDSKKSGTVIFDEETEEGTTVGDVLRKLAAKHQAFGELIFEHGTDRLSEQVSVALNDRLLEAQEGMDTSLNDGDILKFFPVVAGG